MLAGIDAACIVPGDERGPVSPDRAEPPVNMWSVTRPDGTVPTGWVLMPLRLFLGVTFLFAGLQKLANPQFLDSASPISIHAQLVGATHSSPIHALDQPIWCPSPRRWAWSSPWVRWPSGSACWSAC